jgi:hypothetical protein
VLEVEERGGPLLEAGHRLLGVPRRPPERRVSEQSVQGREAAREAGALLQLGHLQGEPSAGGLPLRHHAVVLLDKAKQRLFSSLVNPYRPSSSALSSQLYVTNRSFLLAYSIRSHTSKSAPHSYSFVRTYFIHSLLLGLYQPYCNIYSIVIRMHCIFSQ